MMTNFLPALADCMRKASREKKILKLFSISSTSFFEWYLSRQPSSPRGFFRVLQSYDWLQAIPRMSLKHCENEVYRQHHSSEIARTHHCRHRQPMLEYQAENILEKIPWFIIVLGMPHKKENNYTNHLG